MVSFDAIRSSSQDAILGCQKINHFAKDIYSLWRENIKNGMFKKSVGKITTSKFLLDGKFNPASKAFSKVFDANSNDAYFDFWVNIHKHHPGLAQKFGYMMPYACQSGGVFVHVYSNRLYQTSEEREKKQCRLYLNMNIKNIANLAQKVVEYGKKADLPLYFKFVNTDNRSDNFLFYCSYNQAFKIVEMLDSIKHDHPQIFEDMGKVAPQYGVINGYIGFGEDATEETQKKFDKNSVSYTKLRAMAFNELTSQTYIDMPLISHYDMPDDYRYLMLNKSTISEMMINGVSLNIIGSKYREDQTIQEKE